MAQDRPDKDKPRNALIVVGEALAMAVLPDNDRAAVWAEFMRLNLGLGGLTKAELRAAVDAIDTWLNTNAGALNTAIPQPARGALSTSQKARLLVAIVERRYITGS